jgi:hypothetical protein
LLQYLTGGAWGKAVRKPAEAAVCTIPLFAGLMVPMFFLLPDVFQWARAGAFLGQQLPHKQHYLTPAWFVARSLGYFLLLTVLGYLLRKPADRWVASTFSVSRKRLGIISGPGLVLFMVCMMFASVDWVMSLEMHWFSTMFPVILMISQFLSSLALMIVVVTGKDDLSTKQLHDLGNLLLAFVVFWAYVSFSQFLIIWSGNLPQEISWYVHRRDGGWQYVAMGLALFQFAIPFALLLSRAAKKHHRRLQPIAALVLTANVVNVWWLVSPSFEAGAMRLPWRELIAFVGIGGFFVAAFLSRWTALKSTPELEVDNE